MKKKFIGFFAIIGIAGVLAFSLISCGKNEKNEATNAEKEVYLNTFLGAQPNTLDPSKGTDLYGNTVLLNIVEPLVRYNSQVGRIIPAGASEWTVSPDGLVYTFKIRDMKWADGKKVTSEDYAYGIRRSATPETACPYANFMYPLVNGEAVVKGDKPVGELGVATPDESTLVLSLNVATPYFLDTAMQRTYFPQRKDWVEKHGDSYATSPETSPVCGPFILKDWTINSVLNFVKNKDFWNASNVKLDRIKCAVINDTNAVYSALLAGEIDLAGCNDPQWRAKFDDTTKWNHIEIPAADTVYWMINTSTTYMKSAKIRRAIAASLDREDLIKTCRDGVGLPAYWFSPPAVTCQGLTFNTIDTGSLRKLMEEVKDPRALFEEGLKELGIAKKPEEVVIKWVGSGVDQNSRTESEYIQQTMKEKIGCKFEIYNKDWNEFINIVEQGDYDIASLAWGADFNDPCNFLETCYSKTATYPTGWVNEEFDSLIEKAQKSTEGEERVKLLMEAENILINTDAAIIPTLTRVSNSYRAKFLKNVSDNYFDWMGWQLIDASDRGK